MVSMVLTTPFTRYMNDFSRAVSSNHGPQDESFGVVVRRGSREARHNREALFAGLVRPMQRSISRPIDPPIIAIPVKTAPGVFLAKRALS